MQFVVGLGCEGGFECLSLEVYKKKKTRLIKRRGWDSCWVWVSVSMGFRRHGWVLDKSHVTPSSEQLKEFYFHHLEFWSCGSSVPSLRIKCQFSEKSPALMADTMMLWDCLHDTGYQRGYHLDIWPTEEISLALLFSVTILSPCQGLKCPLPHPHDPWCSKHSRVWESVTLMARIMGWIMVKHT